jgi:mannosyltransferase OCH1-like enzyme
MIIPKIIHKVIIIDNGELPNNIPFQNAIDSFKSLNKEYELTVYTGNSCIEFIKKHYGTGKILDAFTKLKPYSYKCDLFRYLVLNIYGGWYSDMRQLCLQPIDILNSSGHEFYVTLDAPPNEKCMYTAFIGSVPGHPILKKMIDMICWNVENDHYGIDCLYPTGPGVFMSACIDYIRRYSEKIRLGRHLIGNDNQEFIVFDRTICVQCKYNNARGADNSDMKGTNDYGDMWRNWDIYN